MLQSHLETLVGKLATLAKMVMKSIEASSNVVDEVHRVIPVSGETSCNT